MDTDNITIQDIDHDPRQEQPRRSLIGPLILVLFLVIAGAYKFIPGGKHEEIKAPTKIVEAKTETVDAAIEEIAKLTAYQKGVNKNLPIEIAELQSKLMLETAKAESVAIELIVGIAQAESNFNPLSTSQAGAAGLMQVLRGKVEIDESQKYDLAYNLKIACAIFKEKLASNNGDLSGALADYSGGAKWYVEKIYAGFVRYRMYRAGGEMHAPATIQETAAAQPKQIKKAATLKY